MQLAELSSVHLSSTKCLCNVTILLSYMGNVLLNVLTSIYSKLKYTLIAISIETCM